MAHSIWLGEKFGWHTDVVYATLHLPTCHKLSNGIHTDEKLVCTGH